MSPELLEWLYTVVTVSLLFTFFTISLRKKWTLSKQICWWVLFGTVFNLYSLSWLYSVYPLIWMPQGVTQLFGIALLHIVISIGSGLCFLVVGCCIQKYDDRWYKPVLVGFSFVLAEVLRSIVISLLYLGDGTTVDLHFTAGTLGNVLSTTPLIEFAYFGGTFALTFLISYLVYSATTLPRKRFLVHLVVIFVLFFITHALIPTNAPKKDLKVGIITTDVKTSDGEELKGRINENRLAVTSLLLKEGGGEDIVVFPEDTRLVSSLNETLERDMSRRFPDTLFVDGDTVVRDNKMINISVFYETRSKDLQGRGKELLLPFNEYIPYSFDPVFRLIVGGALEEYEKTHTYTPIYSDKTILFDDTRIGTIICSEMLSFRVLQSLGKENPDILFYQSRLNVFNNNPLFLMHLRSFSKVAAAQLRTPIISSNNDAPSYIINARGTIVGEIPSLTAYHTAVITSSGEVILNDD